MTEHDAVLTHIYTTLSGLGALAAHVSTRIYLDSAPSGTAVPMLSYSIVDITDKGYIGRKVGVEPRPGYWECNFQVTVWDKAETPVTTNITPAHEDAYNALTVSSAQVPYVIYPPIRTQTLPRSFEHSGIKYRGVVVQYTCIITKP
jgi:hypothetical protein